MLIFRSFDLEPMLIWQIFFCKKVLFYLINLPFDAEIAEKFLNVIEYIWMNWYECMGESSNWLADSNWQFCHSNDLEWQKMSVWVNLPKDNEIVICNDSTSLTQGLQSQSVSQSILHKDSLYVYLHWMIG